MKQSSGLYAVADLTGGPADPVDLGVLGLMGVNDALRPPGAVLRAVDNDGASAASHAERGHRSLAFVGNLDARHHGSAPAAQVALEMVDRRGDDVVNHLRGEWSLVHWDTDGIEATIAVSPDIRDHVHLATDGKRIAIAPDVESLSRLAWVGREIDPVGLAIATARSSMRLGNAGTTILARVKKLEPGAVYRMGADREIRLIAKSAPLAPWQGNFDEAVAAVESELRFQISEALASHDVVAITLSGGLDSSLIACLAAEEQRPGQTIFCLSSVAPPGSGIADESKYCRMVAEAAGLPIEFVVPPENGDPYLPDMTTNIHSGGLVLSPRHYLDTALTTAALERGATAIFFGFGGEGGVSRSEAMLTPRSALAYLPKLALRQWQGVMNFRSAQDNFHVRLAPSLLERLPEELRQAQWWTPPTRLRSSGMVLGPSTKTPGLAHSATSLPGGGIRRYMPLRARQLQCLVAGMPAGFTRRNGLSRALARQMLSTRVPAEVWQRESGRPFSPDYEFRMQARAEAAAARLSEYRSGRAGEYLDLNWLERSLLSMARHGPQTTRQGFEVQLTACCAEFLHHWAMR